MRERFGIGVGAGGGGGGAEADGGASLGRIESVGAVDEV